MADTYTIDYDNRAVLAQLQAAIDALDDPKRVLGVVGETLRGNVQDRFATEADAAGVPWPALSPRYARRKARKYPGKGMLVAEDILRSTIVWQVDGATLLIGSNTPYGRSHQQGDPARNIPARPWLGVSPSDDEQMLDIAVDFIDGAFSGHAP